jgi:hypothetical protein
MSVDSGRARLSELFEPLSSALGIPAKTVAEYSKFLRINGLLPAARARKLGTAFVGPEEAATLLLGVLGSDTIQGATEAVFRLSGLRLVGIRARYIHDDESIHEFEMTEDLAQLGLVPDGWLQSFHSILSAMISNPNDISPNGTKARPMVVSVSRVRQVASITVRIIPPTDIGFVADVVATFAGTADTEADILDEAGVWPPPCDNPFPGLDTVAIAPATVLLAMHTALNSSSTIAAE